MLAFTVYLQAILSPSKAFVLGAESRDSYPIFLSVSSRFPQRFFIVNGEFG